MKEIKFRLWCQSYKEWEKDAWYVSPEGKACVLKDRYPLNPENHILMQYTGLKDKNGKEIWEGDIIEVGKNFIGKIEFDKSEAKFCYKTPTSTVGLYGFHGEVIGNVYQNPELIKVGGER